MSTPPNLPSVLVLASGRGERFRASGGSTHKLDALLAGRPVLEHVLAAVRASGLPWHLERAPHAGMGDSIGAAVAATPNASGWLILPGDLPLIRAATLRQVAQALAEGEIVTPLYHGQRGHPVGFPAACGAALRALSGDRGAASVLKAFPVRTLALDDIGCVTDVDTVEQLHDAQRLLDLGAAPA